MTAQNFTYTVVIQEESLIMYELQGRLFDKGVVLKLKDIVNCIIFDLGFIYSNSRLLREAIG